MQASRWCSPEQRPFTSRHPRWFTRRGVAWYTKVVPRLTNRPPRGNRRCRSHSCASTLGQAAFSIFLRVGGTTSTASRRQSCCVHGCELYHVMRALRSAPASHAHDDERPPRGLCRFSLLLVSPPHATRRYKAYNANRTRVERRKAVAWTALPVVLLLSLATFGGRRAAAAVRHRMWLPQARCRSWAHRVSGTRSLGRGSVLSIFPEFRPRMWDAAGAVFTR